MGTENADYGKNDEERDRSLSVLHKKNNTLPLWGNERTMNLNHLLLTNIQSSHYFKVNLYELKTYHAVIDEIYYNVNHVEPWEKGSRKTSGQTGMCGGVRGVGAGGIVSTAFCLLYKLFTLRLTRKQVIGLITHPDSPYIRILGFMYIRFTQPPSDLWEWYEEFLEDEEELDVRAGGGQIMTMGEVLKTFLCKLDWFSALFPRIPVPIQQKIEKLMNERFPPQFPSRAVNTRAVNDKYEGNRNERRGSWEDGKRSKSSDKGYRKQREDNCRARSRDDRRHDRNDKRDDGRSYDRNDKRDDGRRSYGKDNDRSDKRNRREDSRRDDRHDYFSRHRDDRRYGERRESDRKRYSAERDRSRDRDGKRSKYY